jgi:hypothetical protein
MKSGLSPVVAAAMLIAIAVMASVTVWYWVSSYTAKPAIADTSFKGYSVTDVYKNATNDGCNAVDVKNTGKTTIKNTLFYLKDYMTGSAPDVTYPAFVNISELKSGDTNSFPISARNVNYWRTAGWVLRGVDTDSENNVIAVGYTGVYDIIVYKFDRNGNLLWNVTYDSGNNDYAYAVAVDSNNDIIVAGTRLDGTYKLFVIKYNSTGSLLWNVTPITATAYTVTTDASNNIYLAGYYTSSSGIVIEYDSSGNHLFNFSTNAFAYIFGIARDSSGNLYLGGLTPGKGGSGILAKYDSSGNQLWNISFLLTQSQEIDAVALDSSNNVIIGGKGGTAGDVLRKYDANGNSLWNYSIVTSTGMYGVGVDSNNNVVGAGYQGSAMYIIKLNSSGNNLWNATSPELNAYGFYATAFDSTNSIIGVGNGAYDAGVVTKYTPYGNNSWPGQTSVIPGTYLMRASNLGFNDVRFTCA